MAITGPFEEEAGAPNDSDSDVSKKLDYIDQESEDITPDLAPNEEDVTSDEEDLEEEDQKLPRSPGEGPEMEEASKPNTYIEINSRNIVSMQARILCHYPKMKYEAFNFSRSWNWRMHPWIPTKPLLEKHLQASCLD